MARDNAGQTCPSSNLSDLWFPFFCLDERQNRLALRKWIGFLWGMTERSSSLADWFANSWIVPPMIAVLLTCLMSGFPVDATARILLEVKIAFLGLELPLMVIPLFGIFWVMVRSFRCHFNDDVDTYLTLVSICLTGLSIIAFFAFLHQAAGVICTAPLCPSTQSFFTDGFTRFSENTPDQSRDPLQIDTGFRTGLYFSIVTFTTLGYGDMQPLPSMRLYTSLEAMLGYAYLGLLVGIGLELLRDSEQGRQARRIQNKRPSFRDRIVYAVMLSGPDPAKIPADQKDRSATSPHAGS